LTRPAGEQVAAQARAEESLTILRAGGDRRAFAKVLWNVADINADLGRAETAAAQLQEALTLFVEFGDHWLSVIVLESAAFLATTGGDDERAVRLLGAADAVLEAIGVPLWAGFRERHDQVLAEARSRLGESHFPAAWEAGRRLPLTESIELVSPPGSRADLEAPEGLTARELEVLALVGEGCSDAEVAERLVVSLRTVHAHLRSIYRKLDVHTRSAATLYAVDHGLITQPTLPWPRAEPTSR